MTFPLDGFDAIHASPPCQRYTIGRKIHASGDRHPDLVDPVRDRLVGSGALWVIENVPGAPLRSPAVLCGLMFDLRVIRHRLFESNWLLLTPVHPGHPKGELTGSCKGYSTGAHGYVTVAGNNFVRTAGAKAMGIDWMATRPELAQAIPPAYTEWIGRQLLAHVGAEAA
jgi:DNA (cytosine-5)-methyltransferase 1